MNQNRTNLTRKEVNLSTIIGNKQSINQKQQTQQRNQFQNVNEIQINELNQLTNELINEITNIKEALSTKVSLIDFQKQLLTVNSNSMNNSIHQLPTSTLALIETDWKLQLNEISLNIRRELSDKVNREEMYSLIRNEIELITQKTSVSLLISH